MRRATASKIMNNDQLRQNGEAQIAFANGKPIQVRLDTNTWLDSDAPIWNFAINQYRPKPELKVRPWNCPSDVPLNCWVRHKTEHEQVTSTCFVASVSSAGFSYVADRVCAIRWSETDKLGLLEYSTDRKTWAPCTVTE